MTETEARRKIQELQQQGKSDEEITSLLIALGTDSAIIGGLLGGDWMAAMVGDLLNGGDLF